MSCALVETSLDKYISIIGIVASSVTIILSVLGLIFMKQSMINIIACVIIIIIMIFILLISIKHLHEHDF